MQKFVFRTFAALGLVSLLAGCGGGGSLINQPDGQIRLFNASPDSTLDFRIDDVNERAGVAYLGNSPAFRTIAFRADTDGGYDMSVIVPGTEREVRSEQFFARDQSYLWVAFGLATPDNVDKRLDHTFIPISREAPIGNKARLIIFNALNSGPGFESNAVNFQSFNPSDPNSGDNPQFIRGSLGYGSFDQSGNLMDIDSGTLTFQARQTGSDAAVIFAQKTFTFESGKIYFALVSGVVGDPVVAKQPTITFFEIAPR